MIKNNDHTPYFNLLSILPHKKFGEKMTDDRHSIRGIYQRHYKNGKIKSRKLQFYTYVITRTEAQQAQRLKYGVAVGEWRNLTTEQQAVYNQNAKAKKISGYNLFMKEKLNG